MCCACCVRDSIAASGQHTHALLLHYCCVQLRLHIWTPYHDVVVPLPTLVVHFGDAMHTAQGPVQMRRTSCQYQANWDSSAKNAKEPVYSEKLWSTKDKQGGTACRQVLGVSRTTVDSTPQQLSTYWYTDHSYGGP